MPRRTSTLRLLLHELGRPRRNPEVAAPEGSTPKHKTKKHDYIIEYSVRRNRAWYVPYSPDTPYGHTCDGDGLSPRQHDTRIYGNTRSIGDNNRDAQRGHPTRLILLDLSKGWVPHQRGRDSYRHCSPKTQDRQNILENTDPNEKKTPTNRT